MSIKYENVLGSFAAIPVGLSVPDYILLGGGDVIEYGWFDDRNWIDSELWYEPENLWGVGSVIVGSPWVDEGGDKYSIDGSQTGTVLVYQNDTTEYNKTFVVDYTVELEVGSVQLSAGSNSANFLPVVNESERRSDEITVSPVGNTAVQIRADSDFIGSVKINFIYEKD